MADAAKKIALTIDPERYRNAPVTGTPIRFDDSLKEGQIAQYRPSTTPLQILSLLPFLHKPAEEPEGTIVVNPKAAGGDLERAISHESVHAITDKLGYRQIPLAREVSNYNKISDLIGNGLGGFSALEAPAYTGVYGADIPNLSYGDARQYATEYSKKLEQRDPRLALMYRKIAGL